MYGFSEEMRARFFRPFLGGVFLEQALSTPGWIFELVWAAFSRGAVVLPRDGMGAIAHQLVAALPAGTVRLGTPANRIGGTSLVLESGEHLAGDALVIATDYATSPDYVASAHRLGRHESRHACILMRPLLRYAVPV